MLFVADLDNISDRWLNRLTEVDDGDEVLLLYTDKSEHMLHVDAIGKINTIAGIKRVDSAITLESARDMCKQLLPNVYSCFYVTDNAYFTDVRERNVCTI